MCIFRSCSLSCSDRPYRFVGDGHTRRERDPAKPFGQLARKDGLGRAGSPLLDGDDVTRIRPALVARARLERAMGLILNTDGK